MARQRVGSSRVSECARILRELERKQGGSGRFGSRHTVGNRSEYRRALDEAGIWRAPEARHQPGQAGDRQVGRWGCRSQGVRARKHPTLCREFPSRVRTHPPRARARARRRPPINPSACRVGLRVSARARRGRHERAHRSALALDSQSSSVTSGAPTFNLPTLCRQVRRAAAWGVTPCSRPR